MSSEADSHSRPVRLTVIRDMADDVQHRWIRLWIDGAFRSGTSCVYGVALSGELMPGHHRLRAHSTLTGDIRSFDARPGERLSPRIGRGGFLIILMIRVAVIRVRLERVDA